MDKAKKKLSTSKVAKRARKYRRKKKAEKKAAQIALEFPPFDCSQLSGPVIGVDEVGRGCLAGRVYAAAVILPPTFTFASDAITDSKLISEERRTEIAAEIRKAAQVSIAFAEVEEIDEINILKASLLAMKRAIAGLGVKSGTVLVDGNQKIPKLSKKFEQITIIKGDLRAKPIGAASIVAKVERDLEMTQLAQAYPQYGFEKHKGYASESHRKAIQEFGPCSIHRKTFCCVKEYVDGVITFIPPEGLAI